MRWLLPTTLLLLTVGCEKKPAPSSIDAGSLASTAGDGRGSGGGAPLSSSRGREMDDAGHDEIDSVYAADPNAPANPLAARLCEGLTSMPEKKRAACCATTPGIVTTSECSRTLSAALGQHAIRLEAAAIDACIAAFDRTLEGCDWVGPFAPGPPAACQGLVHGLLASGQRCRSSLECTGSLRCKGVGPTTLGTCSGPKAVGELCGGTVDALATYVRQNDLDRQHPECASGHCIKHRCAEPAAESGTCQVSEDCGDGMQCVPGANAKTRTCVKRPPPKEGEACPGGVCDTGLSCISNRCTVRKPAGEACTNDFECRGGCLKGDAGLSGRGTCGPRCDLR